MTIQSYPFHADAAGAATIFDPITRAAVTTLPFRGKSTEQKLLGVSVAVDAVAFKNNLRIRIGNSLPDYRYLEIPVSSTNCSLTLGHSAIPNFHALGGAPIFEGDTLTLTLVTGTFFSGVLYVDDLEGPSPPIPKGNIVVLDFQGLADLTDTLASTTICTKKLENSRQYHVYKAVLMPEGSAAVSIEMIGLQCGSRAVYFPMDTIQFDRVPLSFSGLEWNNGQVLCYGQAEAAEKFDLRVFCIETALPGKDSSQAAPVNPLTIESTPGVVVSGSRGTSNLRSRR